MGIFKWVGAAVVAAGLCAAPAAAAAATADPMEGILDTGYDGLYEGTANDDWFYDAYQQRDSAINVRDFSSELYSGTFDRLGSNDWFFDAYEAPSDESIWGI